MAQIIHFPVAKRMPSRVAEEKLGAISMYRSPDRSKIDGDVEEWLEKWLMKKSVLLGWEAIKEGVVRSFKSGRVRHLVSRVEVEGNGMDIRPRVEVFCSFDLCSIFNWESCEVVQGVPAIVLSLEQSSYFRICKNCLSYTNIGRG